MSLLTDTSNLKAKNGDEPVATTHNTDALSRTLSNH